MNLIIYVTGRPNIYGYKRMDFLWSEAHGCYLYEGKEIPAEQFNDVFPKVFSRYQGYADMNPRVKVMLPKPIQVAAAAVATETVDFGDTTPDKKKRLTRAAK